MTAPNTPLEVGGEVTFTNSAPDDEEWTAYVQLLNEWTTLDRYLRQIIQYARGGKHYPADMHVYLIEQVIAKRERAARLDELRSLKLMEFENGQDDFTYYDVDEVADRIKALEQEGK